MAKTLSDEDIEAIAQAVVDKLTATYREQAKGSKKERPSGIKVKK